MDCIEAGQRVIGIDEVGRGCLAGPLVVGAVMLGPDSFRDVTDSKLIARSDRPWLAQQIKDTAVAWSLGWCMPDRINQFGNINKATTAAIKHALQTMPPYDLIVIDGNTDYLAGNDRAVSVIQADISIPPVSAASIIAKVARDDYMVKLAKQYPGYGFENNVGYDVPAHRQALADPTLGVISSQHRLFYKPIRELTTAA
jgi:ribonuclease HII